MRSVVLRAASAALSSAGAQAEAWPAAAAAAVGAACCRCATTSATPGTTSTSAATATAPQQQQQQQQQLSWQNSWGPQYGRGFFTTCSSPSAAAAAQAAAQATTPPRPQSLTPRRPSPAKRSVPQELESMGFRDLLEYVKANTVTNPLAEAKLLLLVQRAASLPELEEALALVRVNRLRATRMRQYCPFTAYMPNALLQTAKRVGAPPSFFVTLLSDASLLGLPISTHVVEETLTACVADAPAFNRAWLLARAHQPRVSKHALFIAVRTLTELGRRGEALAAVREFTAAGGQLSPSLERWVEEAKQQQQEERRRRQEEKAQQQKGEQQQQQQQQQQQEQPEAGSG